MRKNRILTTTFVTGLGLAATLACSAPAWAQDAEAGEDPGQGIAVGEPAPDGSLPPDVIIDDGWVIDGWVDEGSDEGDGGFDDGHQGDEEDWVDDGGDEEDWSDEEDLSDGDFGESEETWPTDEEALPVIYYTTADGSGVDELGPEVLAMGAETAHSAEKGPAAHRVMAKGLVFGRPAGGTLAECLVEFAALPWICEWQYGADE